MISRLPLFLALLAMMLAACASTHDLARFDRYDPSMTAIFNCADSCYAEARLTLTFRGDGVRGKVHGKITRAGLNAYRMDLKARNRSFVKAYVTDSLTVVWPESGEPILRSARDNLLLSELIEGLPDWPFRDCLPFVFISPADSHGFDPLLQVPRRATFSEPLSGGQSLTRDFSRPSGVSQLPYCRIALSQPDTPYRLTWSLVP